MPGPVPKRSDQRRHRIKPDVPQRKGKAQPFVDQPPPVKGWHKEALAFYRALALSGQSVWYEPSDWVTAKAAASILSELYIDGFHMASKVQAFHAMTQDLLATEGARRRARVELHREPAEAAPVKVSSRDRDRKLLEAV